MESNVRQLSSVLEAVAPLGLAEEWDNVGLQLGSFAQKASRVMLTLDIDEDMVDAAIAANCELIIAHHPLIFRPLKAIRTDLPSGRVVRKLLGAGIAVYVAHTNWDKATGGTSHKLAGMLDLRQVEVLKETGQDKQYKLVVFVPRTHQEVVMHALVGAGAGHIGNYSHCSFSTHGQGTFRPETGAQPFLGAIGSLETVEESRLEMIVPAERLKAVVAALQQHHPYEEVAYDVLPLVNGGAAQGLGCIGELPAAMSWDEFAGLVAALFPMARVGGAARTKVGLVAVCGGSGGDLVPVAKAKGADALITGDVSHHAVLDAASIGLAVIDAGHYATEAPILSDWQHILDAHAKERGLTLEVIQYVPSALPWRPLR